MESSQSFKSILEKKLSKASSDASNSPLYGDNSPANLAFLIGEIGNIRFSAAKNTSQLKSYLTKKSPPPPAHKMNEQQLESFLFVYTWAGNLKDSFTLTDLKLAFRRAALKLHPDQGGCDQNFINLREHIKNLECVLLKKVG